MNTQTLQDAEEWAGALENALDILDGISLEKITDDTKAHLRKLLEGMSASAMREMEGEVGMDYRSDLADLVIKITPRQEIRDAQTRPFRPGNFNGRRDTDGRRARR